MRAQGLTDLPNPTVNEDGISFDFSHMTDAPEKIKAAQKACEYVLRDNK